jgi:mono/diheme cytochrome c family protein
MFSKTAVLILIIITAAVVAFSAVQGFPDGDGKKLIEDRCVSCHGPDQIVTKKVSSDEWKKVVDRMVGYGANLDDKETKTAVDYLAKAFGPAGGDAKPGAASADKAAKDMVEGVCASCHDADQVTNTRASKEQWQEIVTRMNDKGASLSAKDTQTLVDYLAKTYGPK